MTKARATVSASLAARGRPEFWANEQEAAALSGMGNEVFNQKIKDLEAAGFPRISSWNNKRFIPHIIAFWENSPDTRAKDPAPAEEDERNLENWGHERQIRAGKRLSS